jgi:hypothetical protein
METQKRLAAERLPVFFVFRLMDSGGRKILNSRGDREPDSWLENIFG